MGKSSDGIIGVEWLATLDYQCCSKCKSLDGRRWKKGQKHPTPPLHAGCRCVLIPVTELTDLGEDVSRPMANADFMQLAKKDYEKKYPGKTWNNLSPSTRKKYYYQAQRDFEARTGKPAYSFVTRKRIADSYIYSNSPAQEYIPASQYGMNYDYNAMANWSNKKTKKRKKRSKENRRKKKSIFEKIIDFFVKYW